MISLLATLLVLQATADLPPPAGIADDAQAERRVVVLVLSGRRFAGEIDPKTDTNRLWLRTARPGATLLRPITWDRVVSVELPEDRVWGAELRAAVRRLSEELAAEATPREL